MDPIKRGVKNVFRNLVRSVAVILILSLAVGLSLVMLVARQGVDKKITSIKSSVGNTITIYPAGFSSFSSVNNALTTTQLNKVKSIPHITSLTESLSDRLTTIGSNFPNFGFGGNSPSSNNQTSLTSPVTINLSKRHFFIDGGGSLPTNFSPPISVVGTNNPNQVNGSTLTISSGKMINGDTDNSNALVSNTMATKNNLKVGSTFKAYNSTLTVAGIFKASTQATDNTIVVALPTLERLSGQSDAVTSAVATVDSSDNLSSTTSAVKQALGSNADIQNSQQQANATIQPLQGVETVAGASLIGALIAGSIIIFLVTLLLVRERRREIGVLKAIGASSLRVMVQFTAEATALTLMASVLGIIIGGLAAGPITSTLVSNAGNSSNSVNIAQGGAFVRHIGGGGPNFVRGHGFGGALRANFLNVHAAVGWSIILYGLAAAVVIALIGSSLASFIIAKVRPAEVLRTE